VVGKACVVGPSQNKVRARGINQGWCRILVMSPSEGITVCNDNSRSHVECISDAQRKMSGPLENARAQPET